MINHRRHTLLASAVLLGLGLTGCGEGGDIERATSRGTSSGKSAAKKAEGAEGDEKPKLDVVIAYQDDDFVESERNRDPFRSYMNSFRFRGVEEQQRRVVMPSTAVEEMRLIAIITGTSRPRAMLLDSLGVGHVVERGMYIGRPKVLQATGNVSMTLNWRVDRIRENEVVLTRQDPTDPSRAPLTRVIPLRQEVASR